ncbi:MAG: hypothetical protein A2V88_02370 [Elusimicrobia bacterium RBG_16_66_12]|nr:MAG: hypothetical protein A2V88_02370 [Elusimicrobia bacterium RBG_16_66_12]
MESCDTTAGGRARHYCLTLRCVSWGVFLLWQLGFALLLWRFSAYLNMSTQDASFFDRAGRQRLLAQQMLEHLQMVKEGHKEDRGRLRVHSESFGRGLSELELDAKTHRVIDAFGRQEPEAALAAVRSLWDGYRLQLEDVSRLPLSSGRFRPAYEAAVAGVPRLVGAGEAYVRAEVLADQNEGRRIRRFIRVLAGLNLLLSALVLLFIHRWFLQPMAALQASIERFEGGDFSARTTPPNQGEMRSLIEAFNLMTQSLERSTGQLREILDNSPAVVFIKDLEGRYLFVNRRYEDLFHCKSEALRGKTDFDVFPAEAAEKFRAADQLVLRRGDVMVVEEGVPQDDGLHNYISAKFPLRGPAGEFYAVCGIATDVTEIEKIRTKNVHLTGAVEHATDGILMTDADGKITFVNAGFEKMTGFSRQEALGANPRILKSGKMGADYYRAFWKTITSGEVWSAATRNRRKDGGLFDVHQTVSPLKDAAGRVTGYLAVMRDVTESLRLEAQLRQSQKMDAVGRLAAGVAHDFNNILTSILGYCGLIKDQVAGDAARADLDEITAAGERAAALTHQLLAFSRKQTLSPRVVDLNAVVADMERMLKRVLGENAALVCRFSPDLGRVKADKNQLEQVILNLAVNARDAMPGGGTLIIETVNREFDGQYCRVHPDARPGRHAGLIVTDTGTGMDARTLERIFEPFFTTKEIGRGTGLGLSMVYGIVQQSDGHVDVRSEPGKGTSFEVYLPAVAEALETEEAAPPARLGGGEVVLLVEDEEPLLRLTARLLAEAGYSVLQAGDAERALALFRERGPEIRLLLTDVILPKNNGRWLAEELRKLQPALRVLYMSGYTDEVLAPHGVLDPGVRFLPKPFTSEVLFRAVRAALDA